MDSHDTQRTVPEDPVVDHQELRTLFRRAAEALHGGIDREGHAGDFFRAGGHLQAVLAGIKGRYGSQVEHTPQPAFDPGECHAVCHERV